LKKGLLALSPLLFFVVLYLLTSLIAGDFYKVPITVAFMLSSIYAVIVMYGFPLDQRIKIFLKGAGGSGLMLMIWIFVLAGAFANSAKVMGSIDATVNLTLTLLPGSMILAGLFVAACFISMSIGTSVGTIVALTPIATGLAEQCGSPAAVVILLIYIFMGSEVASPEQPGTVDYLKVIPYLVVIVCAAFGVNVLAVLTLGIMLTGIVDIAYGQYDLFGWFQAMGDGILSMGELIIITMMAGGMLEIIRVNGGIDYLIETLTKRVSGKRGAYLSIGFLVSVVDVCTANNTVAILTVGDISKRIGEKFGLDSRKCASVLISKEILIAL